MSDTLADLDNEETLFQFDSYDPLRRPLARTSLLVEPGAGTLTPMISRDIHATEELGVDTHTVLQSSSFKGKERSLPMPIRSSTVVYDLFGVSPPTVASPASYQAFEGSSSSSATFSPSYSTFSSPRFNNRYDRRGDSDESFHQAESIGSNSSLFSSTSLGGKGKEKENLPVLPPLSFPPIELDCGPSMLPSPGPSSSPLSVDNTPMRDLLSVGNSTQSHPPTPVHASQEVPEHPVAPNRSLSNLTSQLSLILGSTPTPHHQQLTHGLSRTPSNLSRQRILEQDTYTDALILDTSGEVTEVPTTSTLSAAFESELGGCSTAWYTVSKATNLELTIPPPPNLRAPIPQSLVLKSSTRILHGDKLRSQSSLYPISALDYIPVTATDIFHPLPIVVSNYFDLLLPRELRLHVLRSLVELHEQDYRNSIRDGRITMTKATSSRSRWVGRDKGVKELFRLSRVSKAWQLLVFDGELWADLDLHSFPSLPPSAIIRLTQIAGSFAQSLNLAGHIHLSPDELTEISIQLRLTNPGSRMPYSQLTALNLQGCTALTTRSLHRLLVQSRSLQKLVLRGLGAVTNTTCDIIADSCPRITSLNVSRCANMDAEGIRSMALAAMARRGDLCLKELRLCGLKYITDSMMHALGKAAPFLEILDLSYARHLHNSAIEAFIACDEGGLKDDLVETIVVSARDIGRETTDVGKFRRRVTRLRHLSLSFCVLLTDTVCSNLAFSVPDLEFLELAGIGPDLKDGGLIRLLSTTPNIRKLDLEDATDITDDVLAPLTPYPMSVSELGTQKPEQPQQPGHMLQQLNISYAQRVTDSALLSLIRNCPHLTVLEADNTRLGATVLREFIHLSRQRKAVNAKIVAVDCRGIGESLVKELSPMTRPRLGWRAYEARKLLYLDARDGHDEDLKIGQDECDVERVVVKTFYSWQTVDAVKAAKEKRRKQQSRRTRSDSSAGSNDSHSASGLRTGRWWSPGGRRSGVSSRNGGSGSTSPPLIPDLTNDGCRTM